MMPLSRNIPLALATTAVLALALSACEPKFDYLDLDVASSPPTATTVWRDQIKITSGVAVVIHAEPVSSSPTEYDSSDDLELASENGEVLEVLRGQDDREFALVGVWPGETNLIVKVNGHVKDRIPFRCVAYE